MKKLTAEEARRFKEGCREFKEYPDIESYKSDIITYLVYSSWRYTEEEAKELVESWMAYVEEAYKRKESAFDCAAEVGYSCG